MGDKKSPTRPKRQPKPSSDEGYWDCSVCTFRNGTEAFKCMMCDVRKGTSTRKPRPVSQLVAQQRSAAVIVGDLTVIITDFKEKTKAPPASSAASADQHSQSGSGSDNTERGVSRSSSPRGEASSLNGESH
ncbi:Yy1-Associated Factor 2 [Manis pentadactyla]|nr:Yy1-Associated Factor 2 [Manis pentadactyla]